MKRSNSSLEKEVKYLNSQLTGLEILLRQNRELEEQVNRLVEELDNATQAVVKRGHLYKWREKEFAWATRWGSRYFTLQGSTLSYFGEESEKRPRRTIDLSKCVVRHEGTKKNGTYHVFSIYLVNVKDDDEEDDDATHLSLLLRLSSDDEAEASQWIDMLEQGCAAEEMKTMPDARFRRLSDDFTIGGDPADFSKTDTSSSDHDAIFAEVPAKMETTLTDADPSDLSPVMLERVQSASESLKRVVSRQTMARRVLAKRSPQHFTASGTRIDHLVDNTVTAGGDLSSTGEKKANEESVDTKVSAMDPGSVSGLRKRRGAAEGDTEGPSSGLRVDTSKSSNLSLAHPDATAGGKKTYKIKRSFPASKPMHVKAEPSFLSAEQHSGVINYRGFFNLAIIILLISNARIIIDAHKKYGFVPAWKEMLFNWRHGADDTSRWLYLASSAPGLSLLSWFTQLLISYLLETFYEKEYISERGIAVINIVWCFLGIAVPVVWVWYSDYPHPGARMTYLFQSVVLWMKIISYHHAHRDLRVSRKVGSMSRRGSRDTLLLNAEGGAYDDNMKPLRMPITPGRENMELAFLQEVKDIRPPFLRYPENLTVANMLYFSIAPTLTYQLNYPQAKKGLRWSIVLLILFRMMVVSGLILFATESYIMPTVQNSMEAVHNADILSIMERVLKLSIPNTYVWLLVFYFYFHLWLNLLAELTCFGDRIFYKDWWNARTIDIYWRNWNIPVHNWILRHLYYPLLRLGAGKVAGTFAAFFFSAALHEVILSVPFKAIYMHAFVGMLLQAPLSYITKIVDKRFDNAFFGNVIFWMAFCIVGQPIGILLISYEKTKSEGGIPAHIP